MSFTHQIDQSVISGGVKIQSSKTYSADANDRRTIIVTTGTNQLVALAFSYTLLQSLFIVSDQDVTLDFETSGAGTPAINLIADAPFIYTATALYYPSLFTVDITKLWINNTSGSTATVNIDVLVDSTA